jgi:hypothetical protein
MTCPSLLLMTGRWRWLLWRGPRHAQYEHPAELRTLPRLRVLLRPRIISACILCMHSVPSAMAELTP